MRRYLSLALLLAIVLGWFFFLRPTALGGDTAYVIVSGDSMLPTHKPGDLVITRAHDSYSPGDIAVFNIPDGQPGAGSDARVIHRLTGGDGVRGYTTQGDNRDNADPWTPTNQNVVGSEWVAVPGAGKWLQWLLSPIVVATLAGGVTTFIIMRRPEKDPTPEPAAA